MDPKQKLIEYVREMPQPGSGRCNSALLGAASVGIIFGLSDTDITQVIMDTLINPGPTTKKAVYRALQKAHTEVVRGNSPKNFHGQRKQAEPNSSVFQSSLARQSITMERCREMSPISLGSNEIVNAQLMMSYLFAPDDMMFIGRLYAHRLKRVSDWLANPDSWGEHIIPNPLDGQQHILSDGKPSVRCDAAVRKWRYAVAEFDNLPIDRQIAIWLTIDLPIAALIFSGGKSVHAWIYVDASPDRYWQVKELYRKILFPLGCDPNTGNPSRLSRMPGVYRTDRHTSQRLLYLQSTKILEDTFDGR